ncbi:MAG TPA: hypothetical protein VF062_18165 [Candidatus Limnocylindrales bacterium]
MPELPLAAAVRDELVAAGLPVLPLGSGGRGHDDDDRHAAGGLSIYEAETDQVLWVGWATSEALRDAAVNAMEVGAYRADGSEMHPAIRHSGTVQFAIAKAVATILESAGYRVEEDFDDLQPGVIQVRRGEPGPTWRDPATPVAQQIPEAVDEP